MSFVRQPVKRLGAEQYLLITLLSFAGSVILTRLFLELTGYPRLGKGELHVAHVLWGGLMLFIASILPLILVNRWVLGFSAFLSGTGVGLFIDEVGKFITSNNDYFYPMAAPIIYAFFLLTVMVYLRVRRPADLDPRVELYHAFDALEEVLDHDLDPLERAELVGHLRYVVNHSPYSDLKRLAKDLLDFVTSDTIHIVPEQPGLVKQLSQRLNTIQSRWLTRNRLKAALTGGLFALGIIGLFNTITTLPIGPDPINLESILTRLIIAGRVTSQAALSWFAARLALEISVRLLFVLAGCLLLVGRDEKGVGVGYVALLLSLTTVNLLVFYFDQFSTILSAIIQFWLLVGLIYYRQAYLLVPADLPRLPSPQQQLIQ